MRAGCRDGVHPLAGGCMVHPRTHQQQQQPTLCGRRRWTSASLVDKVAQEARAMRFARAARWHADRTDGSTTSSPSLSLTPTHISLGVEVVNEDCIYPSTVCMYVKDKKKKNDIREN